MPMLALDASAAAPAQFVFDLGVLGGAAGRLRLRGQRRARVGRSGPAGHRRSHAAAGLTAFPAGTWPQRAELLHVAAEKRATFQCTPGLRRPPADVRPGLWAAGDYVAGPYPATLEGAVRAGRDAAMA